MPLLREPVRSLLDNSRQFSEPEAWRLFRLAAIAEAIGWSLLILGIIITTYLTPGNRDAVVIAGQIHGIIFLTYIIAAAVFSLNLGWSPQKTVIALAASIPPYGSLVFEWWAARSRAIQLARDYRQIEVRAIVPQAGKLLAVQPAETANWLLPGGQVLANETARIAVERYLQLQTGITAQVGDIRHVVETELYDKPSLILYFNIKNIRDFTRPSSLSPATAARIDEIAFVNTAELNIEWLNAANKSRFFFGQK